MRYTYTNNYKTLETFKITDQQEIYIGIELSEEGIPVVINHIKEPAFVEILRNEPLVDFLENLVYMETLDGEVILITKVIEAEPLLVYLEDNYIPMESRMNLALLYLKEIEKYDNLTDNLKNILIDEDQLVIMGDRVALDELILVNEMGEINFNSLCNKIASVLEKVIYFEYKNLKKEELLLAEVQHFLDDLRNSTRFSNFYQIAEEFRKLYIYHVCMESIEDPNEEPVESKGILNLFSRFASKEDTKRVDKEISNSGMQIDDWEEYLEEDIDRVEGEEQDENQKRRSKVRSKAKGFSRAIPIAVGLAILVGVGAYGFMTGSFTIDTFLDRGQESQQQQLTPPEAYFTIVEEKNYWEFINGSMVKGSNNTIEETLWEITKDDEIVVTSQNEDLKLTFNEKGLYTVTLTVRDSNNQWSEKYSQTVSVSLAEDKSSSDADGESSNDKGYRHTLTAGITKDPNTVRSQNHSFKVEKQDQTPQLKINLEEQEKKIYDSLTFWIKASTMDQIKINIKGYNQGSLNFQKDIVHSIKIPETWEMVNLNLTDQELNGIEFNFPLLKSTLWVSDIKLDTFK